MNLRTHISRSNGYGELGMFDESILELEAIEGEDRWHPLVVEARYNTYRNTSILDGAGVGCFGLGMKVMVLALFFISFSLLGTELKEFRLLQLEKRGKDGSELYYLKKTLS